MINDILSRVNRPDFSDQLVGNGTHAQDRLEDRDELWPPGCLEHWLQQTLHGRCMVGNFSGLGVADLRAKWGQRGHSCFVSVFNTLTMIATTEWFTQPADCDIRKCSETGLVPS